MASAIEEHFKGWLDLEIDRARRTAAERQQVLDRKAAAPHGVGLMSGRRINESINLISEICLPLADKVYAKATGNPGLEHYYLARDAVSQLLEELTIKIADIVRSGFPPTATPESASSPSRTMQEAEKLLGRVRKEFEKASDNERWRILAEEEKVARAKEADEPQAANNSRPSVKQAKNTVRNSTMVERALQALRGEFDDGMPPAGLTAKERNKRIAQWCQKNGGVVPPSPSSIIRAMRIIAKSNKSK